MALEIGSLCSEFVDGHSGRDDVAQSITDVVLSTGDILPLVQALGIYLTSTNVDTRSCAIKLLSSVLESSSIVQPFPPEDVHYLVQFYCDRLKDHAVVLPHVLMGLHAVVTRQKLDDNDALLISRSIFKEVYCQGFAESLQLDLGTCESRNAETRNGPENRFCKILCSCCTRSTPSAIKSLQYEERNKVFAIFLSLLTHQLPVFMKCSEEFVLGYVQLVDGERDPRNLLLAFNSVLVIVHSLQFDTLVDDLFDVISCYFPIDFTPPPNDPTAVSRESLVTSLGHCLAGTPKFAKSCLPLLLEKISSDVLSAKLDSMSVVALAAPVYGPVAMEPFLHQLWTAIEREMFKVTVPDFLLACVSAVKAIAFSLSQPLYITYLHQFISFALQNFKHYLNDPDLKLIKPIVQLLCGISMASDPSAACMLPQAIPPILKQISLRSLVAHKIILLGEIKSFIEAVITSSQTVQSAGPLMECKGALLEAVQSALGQAEVTYSKVAIEIFSSLVVVPNLLAEDEVIFYSRQLKEVIFTSTALQECVSSALQSVCKAHPESANRYLISPALDELNADPSKAWFLVQLSPTPSLASLVLPAMISVLQDLASKSHNCADWGKLLPVSTALLKIVKCNVDSAPLTLPSMNSLLLLSQQATETHWKCCSADVSRFVQSISDSFSQNTRHATQRWCDEGIQTVLDIMVAEPSGSLATVPPRCLSLPHLTAFLGAASPLVIAKWGGQLCTPLMELSLLCETSKHAVKAYASILNKHPEGEALSGWVSKHMDTLWSSFPPTAFTAEFSGPLTVWIWMTKALTMRSHELGILAAEKLLELCARKDCIGRGAACGFKLILLDDEEFLNPECQANVKLFYKQHLFVQLLPKLMQKVVEVEEGRKQHLLKCLAYFIVGVPQQVTIEELPKVLPLLLESLCSEDADVKISTLNGLLSILTESPHCFSGHVATLLSQLLCLSCDQTSLAIRKVSLQCIEGLSYLPTHLIYPHRRQVLKSLALCLDDHKRVVRKAAVDARAKWFLL